MLKDRDNHDLDCEKELHNRLIIRVTNVCVFSMIFQACGFGAVKILNWLSKCGCVAAIRFGYLVQELLMFIEDIRARLAILVP